MSNNIEDSFELILKSEDKSKIDDVWKNKLLQQDDIANKFYDLCSFIVDKYTVDCPTKIKVFIGILKTVQKFNTHYVIKTTGPFFWKFKDQIMEGDIEWIYDYDFERQMADWNEIIHKFPTMVSGKLEKIAESVRDHIKKLAKEVPKEKGAQLCLHFLKMYSVYNTLQLEINQLSKKYDDM